MARAKAARTAQADDEMTITLAHEWRDQETRDLLGQAGDEIRVNRRQAEMLVYGGYVAGVDPADRLAVMEVLGAPSVVGGGEPPENQ